MRGSSPGASAPPPPSPSAPSARGSVVWDLELGFGVWKLGLMVWGSVWRVWGLDLFGFGLIWFRFEFGGVYNVEVGTLKRSASRRFSAWTSSVLVEETI